MKDTLQELIEAIGAKEKELCFDYRSSWFSAAPGSDGSLRVELSRPELLAAVEGGLPGFSVVKSIPGLATLRSASGETVMCRLSGSDSGTVLWTLASVADIRREPEHSSELLTQAIMGETMTALERRGDWFRVRMEDDYHGWVRSWHVAETPKAEVAKYRSEADACVGASVAYVRSGPDEESVPVSDVTAGTRLVARPAGEGLVAVRLPGGKAGFMRAALLCPPAAGGSARKRITGRAMSFSGIPYVWGGTSAKGFDCSGLVKRVFLIEGIRLPRDASQQAEIGEYIGPDEQGRARPADLLFFGEAGRVTHVAISLGSGRFVHSRGEVRVNSLMEGDPLFEEKLSGKLLFARCVVS